MKHKTVIGIALVLSAGVLFTACGSSQTAADSNNSTDVSTMEEELLSEDAAEETRETTETTETAETKTEADDSEGLTAEEVLTPLGYDITEYVTLNDYENMTVSDESEDAILEKMLEECEITIPEDYLQERIDIYRDAVQDKVDASGQSFEECMGMTEEEFEESLPENMRSRLQKEFLLEALAKDMDITVSDTIYDAYVSTYVSTYGYEDEDALFAEMGTISELDGEDYVKLNCVEHTAWAQLTSMFSD